MLVARRRFYPISVIVLLLVALGLALLSPLYPDEFAYKIFLERFFISGGIKQSLTPFCSEGFLFRPGLLQIPAAWFWSIISWLGSDWLSYRIFPVVGLVTICLILILHNVKKNEHTFWPILLLITTGPCLYGLVLLRAEILILSFSLVMLAAAKKMLSTRKVNSYYFWTMTIVVLFSLIAYVHPKSLYLTPIVLTSIIIATFNIRHRFQSNLYVILFFSLTSSIIYTSINMHQIQYMSCEETPRINNLMQEQAVNPIDILIDPTRFARMLKSALSFEKLKHSVNGLLFQESYLISYLPPQKNKHILNHATNALILLAIFSCTLYILLKSIFCFLFLRSNGEKKQFFLVVSVATSLLTPFLFNLTNYFYEISYLVCSLMIVSILLWPLKLKSPFNYQQLLSSKYKSWLYNILFISMACVSILSILLQHHYFTKNLLVGYQGPSVSLKMDRNSLTENIRLSLRQAKISEQEPMLIDDLVYDAVSKHPLVIPYSYLLKVNDTPGSMSFYLKKHSVRFGAMHCNAFNVVKNYVSIEKISTLMFEAPVFNTAKTQQEICMFKIR